MRVSQTILSMTMAIAAAFACSGCPSPAPPPNLPPPEYEPPRPLEIPKPTAEDEAWPAADEPPMPPPVVPEQAAPDGGDGVDAAAADGAPPGEG